MNDVKKWERERDAIILSLHEMMLNNEETKHKYHAILTKQRARFRQDDADFFLNANFPYGFGASPIEDIDEPPED